MTHDADDAVQPARRTEPEDSPSFEAALAQLGELVARLESGSLGLSESIDAYERGVTILKRLHEELAAVEKRVSMLVRIDEDGRPELEPSTAERHGAVAEAGSPPSDSSQPARTPRGRGRPPRSRSLPGMDDAGGEP